MSDADFLRAFEQYKQAHPDFFPSDVSISKQHDYFRGIQKAQEEQRRKKEMELQNLDDEVAEREVEKIKQAKKERIRARAEDILKNGKPLEFLLECYRKNHIGHEELSRGYIYAFCCQSSSTAKGLQPSATGAKGSGKSHSIESTVFLFPQEYIWRSTFSDKALYYDPPKQGSMIFIDEKMSDNLVALLKRVMTNFQRETEHRAVVDKKEGVKPMRIPKRQVIIAASTHGSGDDQLSDRMIQLGILNAKEDDQKYAAFEGQRRMEGRPEFEVDDDIETCREMMGIIRRNEFAVRSPKIKFAFVNDRRLVNIFYDFLEASAVLHFMQREHFEVDKVITVVPTQQDVSYALDFEMFRFASEMTELRFTKQQKALHDVIQESMNGTADTKIMTEADIVALYGKSQPAVRKLLYGDGGSPANITGGLVEACRWYVCDKMDGTNQNVIRVTKAKPEFENDFAIIEPIT